MVLSEAVHWVHWLWSLLGGAGQGQLPPVPLPRPPGMSYRATAISAGLRGAQDKSHLKQRSAATSAIPGATLQKIQGTPRPDAIYLRYFRKV